MPRRSPSPYHAASHVRHPNTRTRAQVLPCEPGSALRHCQEAHIAGVSEPMLYVGQLFATFACEPRGQPRGAASVGC